MPRDARAYLWDIATAAAAIERFTHGITADAYAETEIVQSAVERKFELIGEALAQLAKIEPELAQRIPDFRAVIAFRNLLIHGYATIHHDRVLKIVETSLPALRAAVATLQAELGEL